MDRQIHNDSHNDGRQGLEKGFQKALAERLLALHDRKKLLVLPNAWDAGSARLFEAMGFDAVATTSGGMAWSLGFADGEQMPLTQVLASVRRMTSVTSVPVTVDFEAGYGESPRDVFRSVLAVIDAGAAGINIEDGIRHEVLRDASDAAERIAAAREAADSAGIPIVINARVDTFMVHAHSTETSRDNSDIVSETIRRAELYIAAGADGIYPIALSDPETIGTLCNTIDAPVNIGARVGLPDLARLAGLGVARVSLATRLASLAYSAAREAAQRLQSTGSFDGLDAAFGYEEFQKLFTAS